VTGSVGAYVMTRGAFGGRWVRVWVQWVGLKVELCKGAAELE